MARLLIGNSLRGLVDRWPLLHRLIWGTEAALFVAFLGLCWCLPLPWAQGLGNRIMSFVGPRLHKHRHVRRNLELAFPDLPAPAIDALGRSLWGNIGKVFAEYAHLQRMSRTLNERVQIHGREHAENLLRSGRPVIFVTAHLGNWEVAGNAMFKLGLPFVTVYSPLQNPYLDRIIWQLRKKAHNVRMLPREESMRPMIRVLSQGHNVGLIMDQRVDSGAPVPMFGIDKMSTLVPARLALRHGAALVPVCSERLPGGRFGVRIHAPLEPPAELDNEEEQALAMTAAINAHFERWIRERPHDWFCTNRLWPKDARPAGELAPIPTGQA